ncbi:HIT domain-containing protein [candidate division WWE3 bacterium]|nr:HIT domain-containing protein [candidate division WWE3 bacterium]
MATIFTKIINHEAPAEIVYQDDLVTAFRDINPKAPVHLMIIPNKEIPTVNDVSAEDEQVLGHLFTVAKHVATELGLSEKGYRLIVNCNQDAGQVIWHIHMHFLGGKDLGPLLSETE